MPGLEAGQISVPVVVVLGRQEARRLVRHPAVITSLVLLLVFFVFFNDGTARVLSRFSRHPRAAGRRWR